MLAPTTIMIRMIPTEMRASVTFDLAVWTGAFHVTPLDPESHPPQIDLKEVGRNHSSYTERVKVKGEIHSHLLPLPLGRLPGFMKCL